MKVNGIPGLNITSTLIVVFVACTLLVHGKALPLGLDEEDTNNIKLEDETLPVIKERSLLRTEAHGQRTIQLFAVHGICRNLNGRRRFYQALKSTLCHTRGAFIVNLMRELCRRRGRLLMNWIEELFDVDGDGYITHEERQF